MEPISIVNPIPTVLRPPALGYPIENSPTEIAEQSSVETAIEQKEINDRKDLNQMLNERSAIAGRRPNGPIDLAPQNSPNLIDILA